jgi:RecA-family ATPase
MSSEPDSMLAAALEYASWGWPVLPLVPGGKVPATQHGVHDATTDEARIRAWWEANPQANIGIAAGVRSGLMVLDVDPRNGGDDSWARLTAACGQPPDTPQALTAGGGEHFVFRYDPAIRSAKLAEGVDLLADGRYFVAYPSQVNGRHYVWEASSDPADGLAPAPLPETWRQAILGRRKAPAAANDSIIVGNRNAGLTSLAGAMRRHGMSESEILAALTVANDSRCEIPLPSSELAQIARSVARYEPESDVAASAALGAQAAEMLLAPEADVTERLQLVYGDQLSDEYEAPDELVEGMMTIGSSVVVYGDSNSGKTFWALSVATAIATGSPCYGRQTDPGLVIYLASEAPASIRSRMQAIKRYHKCDLANLAMVPVPLNFHAGNQDATDVIALVRSVEQARNQPVRLIIADTLARMSAGANENSGEDMGPIMARFESVAKATGAAMMIIHHNGKDAAKGARGWSGIRAHIDTEIEVAEKDGIRSASVTKQRELPSKGETIYFKLEVIKMGTTKFGNDATTCVAIPDEEPQESTPRKENKIDNHRKAWENAWMQSGSEMREGKPYLSRSALKEKLAADGNAERTIRNMTNPSYTDKLIGCLLQATIIKGVEHGWVMCNETHASALLMMRRAVDK